MTRDQVLSAPLIICAAVLSAAPVLASQESTPLTAAILPDGSYSKLAIKEMGREAAKILKKSGMSLRWRVGTPQKAVNGRLVVVRLVGRCDMDASPALPESGALGWTHEVDGKILPFADVACDTLRGFVGASAHAPDLARGNVLLGRAMGRVLAHELYHIAADTAEHGRDGVAQAALTRSQLTSGSLELEASEVTAVAIGLTRFH